MEYRELADSMIRTVLRTGKLNIFSNVQTSRSGEAGILAYLALVHNGASAGELGEFLHVGASRIANALHSLQEKGLVVRATDKGDRRRAVVTITAAGKARVQAREAQLYEKLDALIRRMGAEDFESLTRLMNVAFDSLESAQCEPAK